MTNKLNIELWKKLVRCYVWSTGQVRLLHILLCPAVFFTTKEIHIDVIWTWSSLKLQGEQRVRDCIELSGSECILFVSIWHKGQELTRLPRGHADVCRRKLIRGTSYTASSTLIILINDITQQTLLSQNVFIHRLNSRLRKMDVLLQLIFQERKFMVSYIKGGMQAKCIWK